MAGDRSISFSNRVQNALAQAVLGTARLIPYNARVRAVGWLFTTVVAPIAGWRKRIRENLALVLPDLTFAERERIVRKVPDNVGRTLIEIYSGEEFIAREGRIVAEPSAAGLDGQGREDRQREFASDQFPHAEKSGGARR